MELPKPEIALRDCGSESAEARWLAALALAGVDGEGAPGAIAALLKLTGDPVEEIRAQAVEGLASQLRAGASFDVSEVCELIQDESDGVRCAVLDNAELFLEEPAEQATRLLEDRAPSVRATAARFLGTAGKVETAGPLAGMLADPDPIVRREAALALARFGDARSLGILHSMLEEDVSTAISAARALGEIGDERSRGPLMKAASGVLGDPELKAVAALSALACGDERGRGILDRMLGSMRSTTRMCVYRAICEAPAAGFSKALGDRGGRARPMELSSILGALHALASVEREEAMAALGDLASRLDEDLSAELAEIMLALEESS